MLFVLFESPRIVFFFPRFVNRLTINTHVPRRRSFRVTSGRSHTVYYNIISAETDPRRAAAAAGVCLDGSVSDEQDVPVYVR